MSDKKEDLLISQYKVDSVEAFKVLFDIYYKPLCLFAKRYVLDIAVAEDIVQELFVKFWEQRNLILITTSVKSYLYHTARNECLNYIKHQSVEEKYRSHILQFNNEDFFHDLLEEEEINLLIYRSIQSLPPRCRQVFEMSRFDGKSFDEISEKLLISRNTVKNQLVNALRCIRKALEEYEVLLLIVFLFISA